MLMKSSSGINIGNGGNTREIRKPTSASFSPSSSTHINKRLTKTNSVVVKSSTIEDNDTKRQEQQLNDFLQPSNSFYTTSISSFQSENLPSKFKFEITPETLNQFSHHHINIRRRPRIQWTTTTTKTRHASLNSKSKVSSANSSIILTSSSMDINTSATTITTSKKPELIDVPSVSITELSSKDFEKEYRRHDNDHSIKSQSIQVITDDDDDGDEKTRIDSASKKKSKSPSAQSKKIKSASKRPKQPSATQISPQPTLSVSPTRVPSQADLATKLTSSTPKLDDPNAGKNLIIVDTSKARSNQDVVRMCLRELGWKDCPSATTVDSDIYWHSSSFHEGNANFAFNSGRVNKFPGMNDLLRKVHLTRSLNSMRSLFANDFDFYPKTWFLPEQTQQFKDDVRYIHQQDKKHNRSPTTFIVKPSDGSQGEGIYLLRDPAHCIVTNRPHVVQEYIDRPLLINGLKFDLRIYVLILNLYPLEIFLYDEGLVRFATVDYKAPSMENLHQTYMHLTNYSLNKRSASYKHASDTTQTDGSKRKLSTVWTQLIGMFGNERIDRTKILITEMINKTILAILPELRVEYEFELPLGKKQNISCFQIIGFDIILTDHLKPILLEVNANPSLRIDFDKENETGKVLYQASPIDEEIKKPLVLETLKLALPKKKLYTFARHAQLQVNDELMAQRVEKVAQRRVDERNEKIKSARKTRFDLRSNPFFSRPSDSITKEFVRLQQEQQQQPVPPQKVLITSPEDSAQNHVLATSNSELLANIDIKLKQTTTRIIRKGKKSLDSTDDDDESGTPAAAVLDTSQAIRSNLYQTPSASIKRPIIKSALQRHMTTIEAAVIGSIKKLKLIFPSHYKSRYRHLLLLDKIAYIYIQLVIMLGHKTMTGGQFRSFANICGIIDETITAPSIDILYYQILRKWQQFVLRTTITGLPFTAFLEAFFLLSQRKFPSSQSLLDSVSQLVAVSIRNLNSCLQAPASPLIHQSNQYLLHRATRINSSINPSSANNRATVVALRSTTTTTNRPPATSSSAPTARMHPLVPSATAVTTTTSSSTTVAVNPDEKSKPSSAKSVFPLFFDVL